MQALFHSDPSQAIPQPRILWLDTKGAFQGRGGASIIPRLALPFRLGTQGARGAGLAALVRRGLEACPFVILQEIIPSETARYADVVLPATTWYEKLDLNVTMEHTYINMTEPAIKPMWESKTDWQIFLELAKKVENAAKRKNFDWFENNVVFKVPSAHPGYLRKVYPGFLQHAGFVAMNPDRHLNSHWDYYMDLVKGDLDDVESHRAFYDEYNAVLDLPAEYYLDTIRIVFQEHRLPKGTWEVRGKRVRPQDIRTVALFTVEGELDDISGSGQTQAAHDLCSGIPKNMKQHLTAEGAGHYGIFSGRRWREMIYPRIRDFIREHG